MALLANLGKDNYYGFDIELNQSVGGRTLFSFENYCCIDNNIISQRWRRGTEKPRVKVAKRPKSWVEDKRAKAVHAHVHAHAHEKTDHVPPTSESQEPLHCRMAQVSDTVLRWRT